MLKTFQIGSFSGIPVIVKASAVYASLVVVIIAAILCVVIWDLSPIVALITGVLAVILHWVVVFEHHYGHIVAARMAGYPITRLVCFGLLAGDRYPKDEPALPPAIHRQRAMGGPIGSLIFSIILGVIALILYFGVGGVAGWLAIFAFADAFFGFFISAFVPLDVIGLETDGSTLLKYWGR
jgi:hypothetical protein